MSVRSRDQVKNLSKHDDRNNEFECKMIHQQLMMDGESDLVWWKQVRKKCKDKTSEDQFSQCESLQGIRVQVRN